MIVKLKIGFELRIARPEINVGLVPDLKVPLGNFLNTVTLDEMLREMRDHVVPATPILGRRDHRLVPERVHGGRRHRKFARHETEFHERAHAVLQQAIVDLIDVREVVNRRTLLVFVVEADLIVEDGMKAYLLEIGDAFDFSQVATIAIAQSDDAAFRTKDLLPEMRQGMSGRGCINDDGLGRGGLRDLLRQDRRQRKQQRDNQ